MGRILLTISSFLRPFFDRAFLLFLFFPEDFFWVLSKRTRRIESQKAESLLLKPEMFYFTFKASYTDNNFLKPEHKKIFLQNPSNAMHRYNVIVFLRYWFNKFRDKKAFTLLDVVISIWKKSLLIDNNSKFFIEQSRMFYFVYFKL